MSAAQIIEQIRALPAEEQEIVYRFVDIQRSKHATAEDGGVDENFKQIANDIFTKNAELFRKLAQ